MIKGHEDITYELTDGELELARKIAPILRLKTKENPVLASVIVSGVNNKMNLKTTLTSARLRKIINFYRVNSILPVISTKKGYYVSYEEEDINNMIQSLTQRANSILDASFGLARILKRESEK
jgi:hypothetical protein